MKYLAKKTIKKFFRLAGYDIKLMPHQRNNFLGMAGKGEEIFRKREIKWHDDGYYFVSPQLNENELNQYYRFRYWGERGGGKSECRRGISPIILL